MSHFAVAVFHRLDQNIADLLAPYSEHLEVKPYLQYTRQQAIDWVRKHIEQFKTAPDEDCWNFMAQDYGDGLKDAAGNLFSTYNPQSKWDWYQVGGRFAGTLKTEYGNVNEAPVEAIDITLDEQLYRRAVHFWEVVIEGVPLQPWEKRADFIAVYKKEYYLNYYKDKETYAKISASFGTYACVTPDGKWHEKGEMGWFGCTNATAEESLDWDLHFRERFIDNAEPGLIVTIVDCHI